jgi:toxin FitB
VLVVDPIRKGIDRLIRRDLAQAEMFQQWLTRLVHAYAIGLSRSQSMRPRRGRLNVPDPMPVVDGLTAATALMHDWTLIMRNVDDVASTGMRFLDPFTGVSSPVQRLAGFV